MDVTEFVLVLLGGVGMEKDVDDDGQYNNKTKKKEKVPL